ncbi:formylmethanofuran--tetrahydromethanopterin N-formyltransferase [Candidatus Bathyarchaeota archaeon]|nr:MAG: formylmethanofuran--tetrahydromethanopterin N-formyltransferase [Candidatus Bathyarchaeota archaeon]
MAEFKVNGVPVEDTFCETFKAYTARILITSVNRKWAFESALEAKGLGRSATIPPSESSIESEVQPNETPDGKPGFIILILDRKFEQLAYWLIVRIRKGVIPYPKTNVFDAMPKELAQKFIEVKGTVVQTFGDGFEEETNVYGRDVFKIPRMDGWFYVESRFGVTKGVAGGMFLILADSDDSALKAAEKALEAINNVPYVAGKFAASGTKVGGKRYKDVIATTNDVYCACLREKTETKLPKKVKCVYEVIVNGLRMEDVKKAMKAGIEKATQVPGVLRITAANYGGTLGKGKIYLRQLFTEKNKMGI